MISKVSTFVATALAIAAFAFTSNAASAQSFSGNWPLAEHVVHPPLGSNPTYCLTLTDDGSAGFAHSGSATLYGSGFADLGGIFQVVNNLLTATFYVPDDNGSLNGLVFVAPASKGTIGKGFAELVSGAVTVTGTLTVGAKGGCSE